MDARTDINGTPPNAFEAVGLHSVGAIPDTDLEPVASLSAAAWDTGFDRFDATETFKKTPYIADLKRRGRDVAKDKLEADGIPLLMKTLRGHLRGDCFTATGGTTAESFKSASWNPRQDVGRSADKPATATGGVIGSKRDLAPGMAAVKVADMSNLKFTGASRDFDSEDAARGPCGSHVGAAVGALNGKLTNAKPAERKTKWRLRATNHTSDILSKYGQRVRLAADAVIRPDGAYEKQCHVDI